ncbi:MULTISPECIES: MATE family efflux transporter [Psychrilyobacter]|uniref:MATE family efflux transporter n=1 Tax=Psychrilyobacter piezotolerans TaxID=2293438 RepID=A0ABX9KHT6_9FUSO|nr:MULTISPECIES: MATE family efflux transporter [Psychrilyobacter]MCS5422874.1 MATE family efflux transporter [Psychrilyobacter sp. S5]NDI77563.1 MATE family efflux transporter [Psychrilyobacter piezotolerans]RDE62926.1 MATE family efflux transporter [Psychrilyobacter sp. S5]REI41684.1 MATE family efflux transporter [Psychrilyobacter piezotolerans]
MKTMKKRKMILEGDMYKVIILLSLPIMLNNLIQTMYNLTDTYFLSKLGSVEVASMTLAWPVVFLQLALGVGIGIAGTTLISQNIGAKKIDEARKIAGQLVSFAMGFSVLLSVSGIINTPYILKVMGAAGEIYSNAYIYLILIVGGAPLMYASFVYSSIKQGEGDTTSPMILSLISVTINIILDPIFIFYLDLGIKGAALATLLARGIMSFYIVYQLFIKDTPMRLRLKDLKPEFSYIKKLTKLGIPASIGQATIAMGFVVLNSFVHTYGQLTLAAFGIGNRITGLIVMPAMGIGGAVSAIVGQNIGNNDVKRVRECVFKSSVLGAVFSVAGTATLLIWGSSIVRFFSTNKDIIYLGNEYLKYISLSFIGLAVLPIITGALQGVGQTKKAMYLSMSRLWVFRLPALLVLPYFIGRTEKVIWYSIFSSNIIAMLVAVYFYKRSEFKSLVEDPEDEWVENKIDQGIKIEVEQNLKKIKTK